MALECPILQCKCVDPANLDVKSCASLEFKGDGVCDDDNNNRGCSWDGGDCCKKTVKGGEVDKEYCKQVGSRTNFGGLEVCHYNTVTTGSLTACMS